LLEEAQSTRDYDVTLAINQMADFLLSDDGADIRNQLSEQLVEQIDQLGVDTLVFARNNIGQVFPSLRGVCLPASKAERGEIALWPLNRACFLCKYIMLHLCLCTDQHRENPRNFIG